MIKYEYTRKSIDQDGLKVLLAKYPFIKQRIPVWIDQFIDLKLIDYLRNTFEANDELILE